MKPFQLILFALLTLLLSGCDPEDYNQLGNTPQGPTSAKPELDAKNKLDAEALAKVKSNVTAARKENMKQPPGHATTIVDKELEVAQTRLASTPTSPDEDKAAEARAEAVYQGKAEEARRLYQEANQAAMREVEQRTLAEAALASALARQEQEREQFKRDTDKLKGAITKLQEAERSKQALVLRLIGAGFLLVFGLAVGFGGIPGLKLGWVMGALGLLFLGVAQVVALWWFKWACVAVVGTTVVVIAWWVWKQYQAHTLTQGLQQKVDALKKVVPILDDAWDNATEDTKIKAWLKEHVMGKLSTSMDKATDKAAIHEIRSENAKGN